jgi:hypothetical protein
MTSLYAQQNFDFPIIDGCVVYNDVIKCDSLNKDEIYLNAKTWIAKTFGDYKAVIQFEDDVNEKLIVKGVSLGHRQDANMKLAALGIILGNYEKISYTITIECKDNRFRYTIDNIECKLYSIGDGSDVGTYTIIERLNLYNKAKDAIPIAEQVLNDVEAVDISRLKKKEKKEHQSAIKTAKSMLSDKRATFNTQEEYLYGEYKAINTIIASLIDGINRRNVDF